MTDQQAGFWIVMIGLLYLLMGIVVLVIDKQRIHHYTQQVEGTVIRHKWVRVESTLYPCAIVSYVVNEKQYTCIQRYRLFIYHYKKNAETEWVIDKKNRLHHYIATNYQYHVDPIKDWFPIGSNLTVYYKTNRPQKAYCGSLRSMNLFVIISSCVGAFIIFFGLLLIYVI